MIEVRVEWRRMAPSFTRFFLLFSQIIKFQFRKEEEKKEKNVILSTQAIGPKPGENRVGMEREEPGPAGCQKSLKENSINQKICRFSLFARGWPSAVGRRRR